jgi:hypothetical protein
MKHSKRIAGLRNPTDNGRSATYLTERFGGSELLWGDLEENFEKPRPLKPVSRKRQWRINIKFTNNKHSRLYHILTGN